VNSNPVEFWWQWLRVAAVVNILAWLASAIALKRRNARYGAAEYRGRFWLLALAAGYVAGCAFRSILPRVDLTRVCLDASPLSSMVIGRSVATVAELCFMAQCALLLHRIALDAGSPTARRLALPLLPLIVVAECASWYAILTTNYLGHAVENSIWTLCAALLLAGLLALWPTAARRQRQFLAATAILCVAYLLFMTTTNVPMYWHRWQAEQAAGAHYLSLAQGLVDAAGPCRVDRSWSTWREEIPWMTLYFTIAVWVSILLPHAPRWPAQPTPGSGHESLDNQPSQHSHSGIT